MDANGNEQFILQFASLCRSEKLSEENIRFGNADQNTIVPPLKPGQDPESLELYRCPSKLGAPHKMWPPPPFTGLWKTFRFTHAKVAELKDQASALCSPDSDVKYISSDDAVSTFIWTRMAAIRSAWLPGDSTTMLYRAVNGRRKLEPEIHAGYMGHSILMWPTKLPIHNVINDDFSSTVIKVRRSLMEVNDNHMRSFFYLLQGEKDKTTINYGAKVNVKSDMLITSFVAQKLYKINFGDILGKPVRKFRDSLNMPHANMCSRHLIHNAYSKVIQYFIRRPNLPDGINLYYMMPATEEGDVDLIAGLSEEEFNSLQKDRKWKEYAELIG